MKKVFSYALLLVLLGGAILYYLIMWAPNTFDGDRVMVISKGESFAQVMEKLVRVGVIRNKLLFKLAGKIHGTTRKIQIGKYRFKSGMSNLDILNDLAEGTSIEAIIVTIPEGLTSRRIAGILSRGVGIDSARFMRLASDKQFLESLGIEARTSEGYLFPKTYQFYWQDSEESLLAQLIGEFKNEIDSSLIRRAEEIGMTLREVLTLASIVEGETRIDSERAIVAGVYLNRLKRNMFLQADPTIQFTLPYPRALKYSDLSRQSPYNTYRNKGLPPGPVNNPGKASILAVLYPKQHKFLFFVADGMGGHKFTKNYKEHLKAVNQYRKFRQEKLAQLKAAADSTYSTKTY